MVTYSDMLCLDGQRCDAPCWGKEDGMSDKEQPEKSRQSWVVWVNSDLTEGRGHMVPKVICAIEATALRLAKKAGVQGGDAPVQEAPLFWHDGSWYGPVYLLGSSKEDDLYQEKLDQYRKAVDKARATGLTLEDIDALRRQG